jgi:glycosyltransferase involved in cell wall biosynthesis
MFRNANIVIVLANLIETQLKDKYYFNRITVLNNPCPIITRSSMIDKTKTILFAATLNENKGYSDLIRAFSLIAHKYPDWKVLFAGNGEIEIGKKLANELNISKQIEFVGWVSNIKKDDIFKKSSFFCLPSHNEGFPMAILDAWAYGLPVITTPVGGIPDIIKDGVNGLIFNVGDINSFSHKIEQLINDKDLSHKLSKASKNLSENEFSINEISNKLDKIYCSSLN